MRRRGRERGRGREREGGGVRDGDRDQAGARGERTCGGEGEVLEKGWSKVIEGDRERGRKRKSRMAERLCGSPSPSSS